MIVVLDTNIWLKELVLNSGAGSALRFFLKHRPAQLAVPEVVRLEVQYNLRSKIKSNVENVARGHLELLALFGSMKQIVLPEPQEIETLVEGVFSGLGVEILDVPFTFENAKSSFLKTIQKVPPNSEHSQQFKDGVLWANCLELLDKDDVVLASEDKAFFQNREYSSGLAKSLLSEASQKSKKLTLVQSIADVLQRIKIDIPIDKSWLVAVINPQERTAVNQLLSRGEAEISGKPVIQHELFTTENPDNLYFTYVIEIPCVDLSGGGRTGTRIEIKGSGTLRPSVPEVINVRFDEERLVFSERDGSEGQLRNVHLSAEGIFIGHKTLEHSIRYRLDQ